MISKIVKTVAFHCCVLLVPMGSFRTALAQNANNPIQVALLRWYGANQATTFTTCSTPGGVAFDGTHVWVSCGTANELQELSSSDGRLVATVTNVFSSPFSQSAGNILYDGANIWVSNAGTAVGTGAVAKVNVAAVNVSGLSTISCSALTPPCNNYAVGSGPFGMAFDGTAVWVANYNSNNIYKVDASGGGITFFSVSGCTGPLALAFDQTYMWVTCSSNASGSVQLLNPNGTSHHTVSQITNGAYRLVFDGSNMWIGSPSNQNSVYEISATSPYNLLGTATVSGPSGLIFDGRYVWAADFHIGMVSKIASNRVVLNTYSAGSQPDSVGFDGGNIWVANSASGTISKF